MQRHPADPARFATVRDLRVRRLLVLSAAGLAAVRFRVQRAACHRFHPRRPARHVQVRRPAAALSVGAHVTRPAGRPPPARHRASRGT
ncbi:conserved protein of unknown function [Burkholderia multivorans]